MVHGVRVLLADPDAVTRRALALLLRSKFDLSNISEAADGATLIRALADHRPDLVLLDWSLPGRPACETLLAMHTEYPDMHLVIMSVNPAHAAKAEALGAVFIHKATGAEQVLEQLRGLLASLRN
jgi:two-component system invasion response regulator UvrY